jgi:hypothetical protein
MFLGAAGWFDASRYFVRAVREFLNVWRGGGRNGTWRDRPGLERLETGFFVSCCRRVRKRIQQSG